MPLKIFFKKRGQLCIFQGFNSSFLYVLTRGLTILHLQNCHWKNHFPWPAPLHHKDTLLTHIQLIHQLPISFSAVLLSKHQLVLLPRDVLAQIITFWFANDELQEFSVNPLIQLDKVLLNSISTLSIPHPLPPFSIIYKLAEDALLPTVQVINHYKYETVSIPELTQE